MLDEIAYALDEKKSVIPVIYKSGDIPLRIRRLQRLDFTNAYSAALANLVKSLRSPNAVEAIAEFHAHDVRPANDQNKRLGSKRAIRKAAVFAAMAQRRAGELGALSSQHASGARGLLLFGVGGALSGIITLVVVEQISELDVFTTGFFVGCPGFSWAVIGGVCEMKRAPSIAAVVSAAITLLVCCVVLGIPDGLTVGVVAVVPLLTLIVALIMRLMVDHHDEVAKRKRCEMRRHA